MEASLGLMTRKTVKYSDIWIRIILSILAAHLIIVQGRFERYSVIAANPLYIAAFSASIIVAFLVITYVRQISKWLDKKYTWEDATLHRVIAQLTFGIVLAELVTFLLISVYYYIWRHMTVFESRWFERYGTTVALMLLILNFYYLAWYLGERYRSFSPNKPVPDAVPALAVPIAEVGEAEEGIAAEAETEGAKPEETVLKIPIAEKDIQSVIHEYGTNIIYLEDGTGHTQDSLELIYESLPPLEYEYFPKNCIIKGSNILDVNTREDGKYDVHLKIPNGRVIVVSERQGVKLDRYRRKK